MSASGVQGEHQVTVTLHVNLGLYSTRVTGDAIAGPSPGDPFHERIASGPWGYLQPRQLRP